MRSTCGKSLHFRRLARIASDAGEDAQASKLSRDSLEGVDGSGLGEVDSGMGGHLRIQIRVHLDGPAVPALDDELGDFGALGRRRLGIGHEAREELVGVLDVLAEESVEDLLDGAPREPPPDHYISLPNFSTTVPQSSMCSSSFSVTQGSTRMLLRTSTAAAMAEHSGQPAVAPNAATSRSRAGLSDQAVKCSTPRAKSVQVASGGGRTARDLPVSGDLMGEFTRAPWAWEEAEADPSQGAA